ncbi:MAG: amidohydrolase family protein [Gemmatimonadales bacterium]
MSPLRWFLVVAVTTAPAVGCSPAAGDHRVAITHVAVRPDGDTTLLADQTILVRDGRFEALGPADRVAVPRGIARIDGRGLTAVPGLTDAHLHLTDDAADWLPALVAAGVTQVFSMDGTTATLALRDSAPNRAWPSILTAGPLARQPAVVTPADADSLVAEYRRRGYDFIKVYEPLTPEAFARLTAAARAAHLPLAGHVAPDLGFDAAVAGLDLVAHAEELPKGGLGPTDTLPPYARVRQLAERRVSLSPTLAMFEGVVAQWGTHAPGDSAATTPEAAILTPALRQAWTTDNRYAARTGSPPASSLRLATALTRLAAAEGVELLVGTDAPSPLMLPGLAVRQEMTALERAGVPRWQVLRAATAAPGRFAARMLPGPTRFGRIRPGYRADLVLLPNDPLADPAGLCQPAGVLLRGRWFDRAGLDSLQAGVVAAAGQARPADPPPAVEPIPADLQAFVGRFRSVAPSLELEVRLDEGRLSVGEQGADPFPLVPAGPNRFLLRTGGVTMEVEFTMTRDAFEVRRGAELMWRAVRDSAPHP